MNRSIYELIKDLINRNFLLNKQELYELVCKEVERFHRESNNGYSSLKYETFTSIYSTLKRRQMFKSSSNQWRKLKDSSVNLSQRYKELSEFSESKENLLIRMSNEFNLNSPVLMARLILDGFIRLGQLELVDNLDYLSKEKIQLSLLIKETQLLKDGRLACELLEACFLDDDYGPSIDLIKNLIGIEYEQKLEKILVDNRLNFIKEEELREKGFDKTPDFKLDIPICLTDGTMISWIDSKATFGDEQSHTEYYESQFKYYLNRFGPGLVIYWFGYLNDIKNLYFNFNNTSMNSANSFIKANSSENNRLNTIGGNIVGPRDGTNNIKSIAIMDHFPTEFTQLDIESLL
jgi:hypothetical protein